MSSAEQHFDRAIALRRGRSLEYLTIVWNLLEGIISVGAGLLAGSIALVGFGIDSFIESLSGGALLWRLHLDAPERREKAEKIALRIIGVSFLLLAAYVAVDAAKALINREPPEATYLGIAIAALSLVVMPLLARAKRRVAKEIHSHAMEADARQTDIHLPICDSLGRVASQCCFWMVVGRSGGSFGNDSYHRQRRPFGVARRTMRRLPFAIAKD